MTIARGTQLGRYEILGPLGKGGMGEVYRAKDTQLGREVAIKVLPEDLAENPHALKRFEREARAVAALSHPNILEIHDSGTDQGVAYAVMELLEGETLRARLEGSAIPWRKALEVVVAVAEGLAAAHTKGVIHRDLKPENIFLLKDGRIKILDFGLARWTPVLSQKEVTEAPTKSQVTELGAVMGTVPYMSPEQVQGDSLDARSDLFSLGSILYEMVAGKRPFSGKSPAETMAAILRDDPPKLAGLPPEVQRVIERCLEKNSDQRFHSAHDLVFALKDILNASGGASSTALATRPAAFRKVWIIAIVFAVIAIAVGSWRIIGKKAPGGLPLQKIESIAVLPLKNLSGDAKQEYFADGMTEELIAKLARIASLRVISRTSVMEYKDAHKTLPEIAKELNVEAIVEGSVLQAGNRVRITAQLIHAATDRHLWADSYERDLQDILSIQNEVASAIAREIQVKVAPEEAAQLASARKVNPQAYDAYLRGLNYIESQITEENIRLAVEMFERAVELDPNFAMAYAELSRAQGFLYWTFDGTPARLAKSKAAVDRAFELQPGLAEGHVALGYYYYRGFRDYDRALQEFAIAQRTLPNNRAILEGIGTIYRRQGKYEEALEVEQKLLAMNPRDALSACELGATYMLMRKYAEAQRYFDLCISLRPDEENGYRFSTKNHILWKADTKGAREILKKAPWKKSSAIVTHRFWVEFYDRRYQAALDVLSSPDADPFWKHLGEGSAYLQLKKPELARTSFDIARKQFETELRKRPDDNDLHAALGIAYAGLGRKEEAIREGKRAVELLPVSKDAMWGPEMTANLAVIYVMVGEQNAALDQIEYLLSIPSNLSVPLLRIDPQWDPLRNHPRFQKLLESR
jgi:serine/threonine protein kinase/tetratricopeptide (TPR) repeat protein